MEFRIDRRTWLRSNGKDSRLRTPDGQMCCLGFFGEALGISDLVGKLNPGDAPGNWPAWLFDETRRFNLGHNLSSDGCYLMSVNDLGDRSDQAREAEITEIFARHGVTVIFEN
jgi:hypothetical protein